MEKSGLVTILLLETVLHVMSVHLQIRDGSDPGGAAGTLHAAAVARVSRHDLHKVHRDP